MTPEERAWQDLRDRGAAALPPDFAEKTLRASHRSEDASTAWQTLHDHAAAQLSPNFAEQTLRVFRQFTAGLPRRVRTLRPLPATATALACLLLIGAMHWWSSRSEEAANLADWQAIDEQAQQYVDAP